MTTSQLQLLGLVRLAIHPDVVIPKSLTAEAIQWEKIFDEAKKQSLIGIAFAGYKRWLATEKTNKYASPIDDVLYAKWYGLTEKIRQRNLLLNKRSAQITHNFSKEGFRSSIMKGQGNAYLYSGELSLLRSPGDIDVWVEGGFEKVYAYIRTISPPTMVNELEMNFNVFSDAKIEVHYRPFILRHPIRNKILQSFFYKHADACFNNHVNLQIENREGTELWEDSVVTTLPFNLVHQLAHIQLHLFTEGIGLRQVMDYYYLMVHAENELLYEEKVDVKNAINSVKLEKLAKALAWILSEYFGLDKKFLLWEPNQKDGEFLLEEILQTGNFGIDDNSHPKNYSIGSIQSFFYVQRRNLRLSRFDKTDWFWGSLWRIYHFVWRKWKVWR